MMFNHSSEDGPIETWHLNTANAFFNEKKAKEAYWRLFQAANSRLQKFFLTIGHQIKEEVISDANVFGIMSESRRMDLSYDDRDSMASILEKGWESAKLYYNYTQPRRDPNLPPLDSEEQWREKVADVENFLKAMDILAANEQFSKTLKHTLDIWDLLVKRSQKKAYFHWLPRYENLLKVLQTSNSMQKRYCLIPNDILGNSTVAGVRDLKLGKVTKKGPVGKNVLRFCDPIMGKKSDFYRLVIDWDGTPNKLHPHIPLPKIVVQSAKTIQHVVQLSSKTFFGISLILSGIRVVNELYSLMSIKEEIGCIQEIVRSLEEEQLENSCAEVNDALELAKELLEDSLECQKSEGKKSFVRILSTVVEWGSASACASFGAKAGEILGDGIGTVSSIVATVAGSTAGAVAGQMVGEKTTTKTVETLSPRSKM